MTNEVMHIILKSVLAQKITHMTTFDCMSRGLHRKPCFHGGEAHFAEPQFSLVGKDKVWEGSTPTTQRNAPYSLIMFSRSTSPANQLQTGSSLWKSKRLGHTTRTPFTHHHCRVTSSWKSKIKIVGMSYSIWLPFISIPSGQHSQLERLSAVSM